MPLMLVCLADLQAEKVPKRSLLKALLERRRGPQTAMKWERLATCCNGVLALARAFRGADPNHRFTSRFKLHNVEFAVGATQLACACGTGRLLHV